MRERKRIMADVVGKIDRKYMAHLIDAGKLCGGSDTEWERLGEDLEEYSVDLSPDTETAKNILGETSFRHNGYEETSEADPYYARTDSTLSNKIQDIIDNRYKDDNCRTDALEVHLWDGDETSGYVAYRQGCYVVPSSYGGDTSGYQTPFTVNYFGSRTRGIFNPQTKTFTTGSSKSKSSSNPSSSLS